MHMKVQVKLGTMKAQAEQNCQSRTVKQQNTMFCCSRIAEHYTIKKCVTDIMQIKAKDGKPPIRASLCKQTLTDAGITYPAKKFHAF